MRLSKLVFSLVLGAILVPNGAVLAQEASTYVPLSDRVYEDLC